MRCAFLLLFFAGFISGYKSQEDTIYNSSGFLKIANPDSVQFTKDYAFNEGVYLDYKSFRSGDAIPRAKILTRVEKNQLDFYSKLVNESDTLVYRSGPGIKLKLIDSIWGYCQNNVIYINIEGTFCRMPVFGNISHFIGTITIDAFKTTGPFYDPYQAGGGSSITGVPLKSRETHEFIFDFYSGKTGIATIENVENILKRDPELYQEYAALKKKHKRSKMYFYLKRYNDKHPVFFPRLG
jgi:hypothetical protein